MRVGNCCFCCSLRTGSLILASLEAFGILIGLIALTVFTYYANTEYGNDFERDFPIILYGLYGVIAVQAIIGVFFFIGVIKVLHLF